MATRIDGFLAAHAEMVKTARENPNWVGSYSPTQEEWDVAFNVSGDRQALIDQSVRNAIARCFPNSTWMNLAFCEQNPWYIEPEVRAEYRRLAKNG